MPTYPSNVSLVTVTGTYLNSDGAGPAVGSVSFTPNAVLQDGTSTPPDIVMPAPLTVALVNGGFSVQLMATDDTDISPSGWVYTVRENIAGQAQARTYQIQLPAAQTPVDLSTVAPLASPPATVAYILASARGAVNGVASLDGTGNVPLAQLGNVQGGGTPSTTVVSETAYGQAATAGTAGAYSRGDHTHGSPSLTGSAASTSAVGDAAAVGAAVAPARADHVHGREAFGAVTGQTAFGAASGNGAAATLARSDHTHGTPALASTSPSTSAVGDAAAVGAGTTAAKADHVHGRETFGAVSAQTAYGAASGNGSAATVSHSDHTHGTPALTSSAATVSAVGDAAAVGTAVAPARADHVHGREAFGAVTGQTAFGAASGNGSAATLSHSDHTHGTPPNPFGVPPFNVPGTVAVATGTARFYNDSGRTLTIASVRSSVGTAPTGAALIVDVKINGTSIFTSGARPSIAAAASTSGTVTPDVTTTITAGQYFTVDVAQVGSTVAGADLTVQITVTG